MVNLCAKELCTGCLACSQICSINAITPQFIDGFLYPLIDPEKCIGCGLCVSSCPVINKAQIKGHSHKEEESCLAAWNKNVDVRMSSSSGGVFSAFAEKILNDGGVVFGAAWNEELTLVHEGIEDISQLDRLRRSKYVQSDTNSTFRKVKEYLKEGRRVLYCGTPCQIAGLIYFLRHKDYDNLLCVDVLCQGVPSPVLFKKYIEEIESGTGVKVNDCIFRTKDYGWRSGLLMLLLRGRKYDRQRSLRFLFEKNAFYRSFFKEYFMRQSCYDCVFKNNKQGYYSDLTIADFWRIGNKIPFNAPHYEKGISAVVVNTDKGQSFISRCSEDLETVERTFGEFETNGGLRCSLKPKNNDEAFEYLLSHTWKETQQVYFPVTWRDKKNTLKSIVSEKYINKRTRTRVLLTLFKRGGRL